MAIVMKPDNLQAHVGKELGISEWFQVDQDRINDFADATLDHQFIHVDVEKAKSTPFGTTIAHGFLTLSLLPHLTESLGVAVEGAGMGLNYGCDKLRVLTPVKVGSKVRARVVLNSAEEKNPGQILIKQAITVEIDGEPKPALVCEWLTMHILV